MKGVVSMECMELLGAEELVDDAHGHVPLDRLPVLGIRVLLKVGLRESNFHSYRNYASTRLDNLSSNVTAAECNAPLGA